MYLESFTFTPKVVKDTLNLVEGRSSSVVVTDYVIFMDFSSLVENFIRDQNSGTTRRRQGDRSQP